MESPDAVSHAVYLKRGKYYICDQKEETWNVLVFLIKAGKTAWIEGCFQLAGAH